jgi:Two component regulator propeller
VPISTLAIADCRSSYSAKIESKLNERIRLRLVLGRSKVPQKESEAHTEYGTFTKRARPTALLAFLLLFLVRASPAAAPYRFFSWTTENGLPQNSIQALLQTRDGYLWLTTLDGLVRFDRVRFQVFNRQNTPALTDNSFTFFALLEDRQGCLWAGHIGWWCHPLLQRYLYFTHGKRWPAE